MREKAFPKQNLDCIFAPGEIYFCMAFTGNYKVHFLILFYTPFAQSITPSPVSGR